MSEGDAVRHPDMNARWAVVNSPAGIVQMSNVGGMLPYAPSKSDKTRTDWVVVP